MSDLQVPHKPLACDAAKLSPQAKSSSSFTVVKPLNPIVSNINNNSSLNSSRARIRSDALMTPGLGGVQHSASQAMLQKFAVANASAAQQKSSQPPSQTAMQTNTSGSAIKKSSISKPYQYPQQRSRSKIYDGAPTPTSWASTMTY